MDIKFTLKQLVSKQIEPFQAFHTKGLSHSEQIFKILQVKSKFKLSRFTILGSKGLANSNDNDNTIKNHTDFDLVIFIKQEVPPFSNVLEDFKKIVQEHSCKKHKFRYESTTAYSLRFCMKDMSKLSEESYLFFELHPAMNLLSEEEEKALAETQKIVLQWQKSLQLISELSCPRKDILLFSSSLAERYNLFLNSQSRFVQQVIILAKLWSRSVKWKSSQILYGRSMIIELVAISVATSEEAIAIKARRDSCFLQAIQEFLKAFLHFDRFMFQLFQGYSEDVQLKLPYKIYVQDTCAIGGPVILDPVNPFNNLAVNLTEEMKEAFKFQAKLTLRGLQAFDRYGRGRFFNIQGYFGL